MSINQVKGDGPRVECTTKKVCKKLFLTRKVLMCCHFSCPSLWITMAPPPITATDDEDHSSHPLLSPTKIKAGSFSLRYKPKSPADARSKEYQNNDNPLELDNAYSRRRGTLQRCLQACQKYSPLPMRILLLSLYLAFTLSSFWILDSIKDPTLATLVDGDLGKHQPRAKMVSFVVVVAIALIMEGVDTLRRRRARHSIKILRGDDANEELEQSWQDRNLPSDMQRGSNAWKKMVIVPERIWKHFRPQHAHADGEQSSKISTVAFYVVGSLYIHFFIAVAIALRQHPSFRPNPIFNDINDVAMLQTSGLDVYPSSEFHSETISQQGGDVYYPFLGYALYALIESFGSVSITIFWAYANSHLTLEAAERHYGSIVAVAQAGAICGSTMSVLGSRKSNNGMISDGEGRVDASIDSTPESDSQVTPMLIFLACGCIAAGMGIMAVYGQLFSKPMVQDAPENDVLTVKSSSLADIYTSDQQQTSSGKEESDGVCQDLLSGLYLIFRYEYLKLVLAVSVLYEIALTCMHYEMNLIGLDRFGVGVSIQDESTLNDTSSKHEGITYIQFMGWYGQTVNVLSLFLSYYAFPRLIKHYGLSATIRIFPTFLLVVTICAFVIFPHNLPFLFISLSVCKALTYSVHDPSEEVLYMPTSDAVKFKAKFWIDVVGQRVAKALGSGINNYAGSIEGIVKYGSLPSIVASIALWFACYQVGVLFDELIKTGDVVGLEDAGEEGLELPEGIETYSQESDADEDDQSPLFKEVKESITPPFLKGGELR